jgi:hypothetical protein
MAESNQVTLNKATIPGGEVAAADTIAAKQYQLIKLILGAAGVNNGPVSATNPLPTGDAAAAAALASILAKLSADPSTAAGVTTAANAVIAQLAVNLAGTQPISAAALPLPAGAASEATLALIEAVLSAWTFSGGAALVTDPALTYVTYSDATYTYYCEAPIGTARSTAAWQVSRKTNATGDIIYAGTGAFAHAATSLAVVGALTYTLGA